MPMSNGSTEPCATSGYLSTTGMTWITCSVLLPKGCGPTITNAQIWRWAASPPTAASHGCIAFLLLAIAKNRGLPDDFMKGLREEPCVIERDCDVQEMMETPDKLRKGMAPR